MKVVLIFLVLMQLFMVRPSQADRSEDFVEIYCNSWHEFLLSIPTGTKLSDVRERTKVLVKESGIIALGGSGRYQVVCVIDDYSMILFDFDRNDELISSGHLIPRRKIWKFPNGRIALGDFLDPESSDRLIVALKKLKKLSESADQDLKRRDGKVLKSESASETEEE